VAIIGFSHLSLEVDDPDGVARFFAELLGMRVVRVLPAAGRGGGSAASGAHASTLLAGEGLRLELRPRPQNAERSPDAQAAVEARVHLSFLVDDLTSTLQSLRDRGTLPLEPPAGLGSGVASARVRTPGGLLVELLQQPAGVATAFDDLE
jgi:catechol 2,3-dioxygenase-like lactoylglutathione lyase family enzyme